MNRPFDRKSKELLFQNAWYQVSQDRYVLPSGDEGEYTYVDIPGSTMVIPVLDDGRLVIVRQYRYLMQRYSLEFPAGGLKPALEPLENAREELREEAGYATESWEKLGEFAPYNGVSNEYCHVYVARNLERVGNEPEPTEEIEILALTPAEIQEKIESGELWDGMTISCLALYSWRCQRDAAKPNGGGSPGDSPKPSSRQQTE